MGCIGVQTPADRACMNREKLIDAELVFIVAQALIGVPVNKRIPC